MADITSDTKSQLQKTGCNTLGAEVGGPSSVRLKEISHLRPTFAKRVLAAARAPESAHLTSFFFFVIYHEENIPVFLYFCRHAASRSVEGPHKISLFFYLK